MSCAYSVIMDKHLNQPRDWWTHDRWRRLQDEIIPMVKELDRDLGQPDCETKSKEEKLRELAEELGYELLDKRDQR